MRKQVEMKKAKLGPNDPSGSEISQLVYTVPTSKFEFGLTSILLVVYKLSGYPNKGKEIVTLFYEAC